jgi:hypothetical protein
MDRIVDEIESVEDPISSGNVLRNKLGLDDSNEDVAENSDPNWKSWDEG